MARACHTHQCEVTACRATHDTDIVWIEAIICRLRTYQTDCALEILPSCSMLCESLWTWCAILQRNHRYTHLVESAAHGSNLKTIGIVTLIATARIDDLDTLRLDILRHVPLDVRLALVILLIGHLTLRPYILSDLVGTSLIACITLHDRNLLLQLAHIAHLTHEIYGTVETKCAVSLVGIEVQLGWNLHLAQLAIDQSRAVRRIDICTTMMQCHRASLGIELEALRDLDIYAIPIADGW